MARPEIMVDVKRATSDGSDVVLVSNEGGLHIANDPNNALAVVRQIGLLRDADGPTTVSGEIVLKTRWQLDRRYLQPIAHRYRTGI